MVFSSIPAYLDPSNWQQQSDSQNIVSSSFNSQLPPPPPQPHGGGGTSGSIRPGSMTDRARMANIPMPEGPLKCPRCESTNTKFCYFNNYNLTQPRHFCKTCRRYWTRGGALRTVPVGGGCRRNKKGKGTSSKSATSSNSCTNTMSSMSSSSTAELLGLNHPQLTQPRFVHPLHSFADFGANQMGLNYGGIPAQIGAATSELNFHLGSSLGGGLQPPQQFPFFGGFDSSTGLYSVDVNGQQPGYGGDEILARSSPSRVNYQLSSVKMEDNQDLNMSRQFLGVTGNDQYWSGAVTSNAWTDLSAFSSATNSNHQ